MRRCLPRSRGDRPPGETAASDASRPAPLTRGSTRNRAQRPTRCAACPAHAGIDLNRAIGEERNRGLPRSRGDRPRAVIAAYSDQSPAPLTRGSTLLADWVIGEERACPAHAGIDLLAASMHMHAASLPRSRGDRPLAAVEQEGISMPAPLTRGSTDVLRREPAFGSACPRSRGDRPYAIPPKKGSSMPAPLTRGSTSARNRPGNRHRACPAHAGIDLSMLQQKFVKRGLPRSHAGCPGGDPG